MVESKKTICIIGLGYVGLPLAIEFSKFHQTVGYDYNNERINNLIEHFKNHKHDNHSKRGLVALVNNRKKLLSYLSKKDNEKYMKLIKELNIRG